MRLSYLQRHACGGPLAQYLAGSGNSTANDALDDDLRAQLRAFMVRKCAGNVLFLDAKYQEAYDEYAATLDDYQVLFEAIVDVNDAALYMQKQNLLANKGAHSTGPPAITTRTLPILCLNHQRKRQPSWVAGRRCWSCAMR